MVANLSLINLYSINFLLALSTTVGMSILPLLVVDNMGISVMIYGLIEGSCEFLSSFIKLYSGKIYDKIKNKKILFIVTCIFAFISKIFLFFPLSSAIFASKISERIANGLFSTPRDVYALEGVANRGMSLAIIHCSKTLGCVIAPIAVGILCHFYGGVEFNMFKILLICVSLTFVALSLSFFIKNKKCKISVDKPISIVKLLKDKNLSKLYFLIVVYFLARFNDGFLSLYLKKLGYPVWLYLGTIGFFNTAMFIISPILGKLLDRKQIKTAGHITILSFIAFNIVFYTLPGFANNLAIFTYVFLGLALWGIQRAGAQVVFCNMVYNSAPTDCKGTAVGLFSCLSGLGTFLSAFFCGQVATIQLEYAFIISGIFSLMSFVIFQKVSYEKRI